MDAAKLQSILQTKCVGQAKCDVTAESVSRAVAAAQFSVGVSHDNNNYKKKNNDDNNNNKNSNNNNKLLDTNFSYKAANGSQDFNASSFDASSFTTCNTSAPAYAHRQIK